VERQVLRCQLRGGVGEPVGRPVKVDDEDRNVIAPNLSILGGSATVAASPYSCLSRRAQMANVTE